ncbi:MAG TPA: hypothetical protein VGA37_00480 [Gemmatimonadales bacterium]
MARRLVLTLGTLACATAGCGGAQPAVTVPSPTAALPTAGLAGQPVTVYPLTLVATDDQLGWGAAFASRREALDRADSLIGALLRERSPEVIWVLPDQLRRAAERAPGLLTAPDQMGTAMLRFSSMTHVPDPLRSQMRSLTGVAGSRFALVPASLVFVPGDTGGRAELTLVLADVRTGAIGWRTVAHAEGADPWIALRDAVKSLVPGLP